MKTCLLPFLLLLWLAQTFDKGIIFMQFHLNQTYIAQKFCENKTRPKLECKGKCQLKKQMGQEEKQDPADTKTQKSISTVLFIDELPSSDFSVTAGQRVTIRPNVNSCYQSPVAEIFHPPA